MSKLAKALRVGLIGSATQFLSLVLILIGVLGLGLRAQAQLPVSETTKAGDAILIMDYSNSMWGQINGVSKIEIARSIIDRNFEDWNRLTNLGLLAYGHRRKNDCNDIQLISPPGELDPSLTRQFLARAQPKGRTPLASSIETAALYFQDQGKKANVILLTDGIESCDRDPCTTIEALQSQGINITAHVIGFGLSAEQSDEISCIANRTGGQFLSAGNADALDEAFRQTIEQLQLKDELQDLRDALAAAQRDILELAGENNALANENRALNAQIEDLKARLHDCEDRVEALEAALADAEHERDRLLDVVEALRDEIEGLRDTLFAAAAENDNLRAINADLKAENDALRAALAAIVGEVAQSNKLLERALARGAELGIEPEGMDQMTSARVPTGETGAIMLPVDDKANTAEAAMINPPSYDRVRIVLAENSSAALDDLEWSVRGLDDSGTTLTTASGTGNGFALPEQPGRYEIAINMNPYFKRFEIMVNDGEPHVHTVNVNMSRIEVRDLGKDDGVMELSFEHEMGGEIVHSVDGDTVLYLPAGQYKVTISKGADRLSRDIELGLGETVILPVRAL